AASGLSYELWYHPTDLTGVPTEVNTTNGWVYVASATGVTPPSSGIANVPVFTNLPGFMIPANATYRVAILASAGNGLYYLGSGASPDTYTSNGLSLYTQGNSISPTYVGYTTQTPYMANTPRGFCGNITFVNTANCSGQPSGGNATGASITCAGLPFSLNATGVSFGLGLEYQWESWDPGTSTWNAVPGATTVAYTHPGVSATTQFRLVTTCLNSGMSANSDTVTVNVTANLPGNTYTINPSQATGALNFNSFSDAVAALSCGISGHVIFEVDPSAGPYTERIVIPEIPGASPTKTVTFKGNGAVINHNTSVSAERAAILLDGADYVTIDSFEINVSAGTYGIGVHLTNGADHNTIRNCVINAGTSATTSDYVGIAASGSLTSPTSSGNAANYTLIENNTVIGGYYGIVMYGTSSSVLAGTNEVRNNKVIDFYYYGIRLYYQDAPIISSNDLSRPTRSTSTTMYVLYAGYCDNGILVEKNKLHDLYTSSSANTSTMYGLYLYYSDGTVSNPGIVKNNIFYGDLNNGTNYVFYHNYAANTKWLHNTIVCEGSTTTGGALYSFYVTGSASTPAEFYNNIISVTKAGTAAKYGIYKAATAVPLLSDHNVFHMNGSGSGAQYVGYSSSGQATLANWQSATGNDMNSVEADPMFVNTTLGDLTPVNAMINDIGSR